ncbi:tripartite tricarboxylate transporter TctB family protein [Roseovarius tibetensis]|uniref:tripartite tricarboxylate transporter TctB family protein n=1 Tax=Roseovarius tibetensis TaxID=2685897 RepID=UPI003D7FE975
MRSYLASKEVLAGGVSIAIGAGVVLAGMDYGLGTPRRMGPGFFPVVLGGLMAFVGLLILFGAIRDRTPMPSIAWRPFIIMPCAIVAFALLLPRIGLGPAGMITVLIAGTAQGGLPSRGVVMLAVLLVPAVWLLFAQLLGVPVPFAEWSL